MARRRKAPRAGGEAYRNLKKYELAQGARDMRQARERERAGQMVLDEPDVRAYLQRRR